MQKSSSSSGEAKPVRCIACQSELITGASLCPVCKSYQSRFKAALYRYGAIAGFLAVAISLLTYVATAIPEIRKALFWRDSVRATVFNSEARLVVQNLGDGEVFLSHIFFQSDHPNFRAVELVNQSIKENSFLTHTITPRTSDKLATIEMSDAQWHARINGPSIDDCFVWVVFLEYDPEFQNMQAFHGARFRALPVKGSLFFYSGKDGHTVEQQLPLKAVLHVRNTSQCSTQAP